MIQNIGKKLSALAVIGVLAGAMPSSAQAGDGIDNGKACQAFLCLYGRLHHTGGHAGGGKQSACKSANSKFFSIRKFGWPTGYKPAKTARARMRYLMECRTALTAPQNMLDLQEVIAIYGTPFFDPPW